MGEAVVTDAERTVQRVCAALGLEICPECRYQLAGWLEDCGPEAMAAEFVPQVEKCPYCKDLLRELGIKSTKKRSEGEN